MTLKLYSCPNGHNFLLTKTCPFCCALNGDVFLENNEVSQMIYNELKGKSAEEIEEYYNRYIPDEEPEICLMPNDFK